MFKMINVQLPPVAIAPNELMDLEIPVYCDSPGKCCGGVCCYLVLWEKEKKGVFYPWDLQPKNLTFFCDIFCLYLYEFIIYRQSTTYSICKYLF